MEQLFNEARTPLDTNRMELLSDKGSEFIVYKYLESVIKLYKKDYQLSHLSLIELNFLKTIITQRILLPTGTVWNSNHELSGYEMPLIRGQRSLEYDSISTFFEELEILKQDLELLCSNLVILRDINLSNTIYNGHLYLVDPGNYLIGEIDKIIAYTNIANPTIAEKLYRILKEGSYAKIKILADSLSQSERQSLVREWNYDKINKLIDMLLFSKIGSTDPFKYRQIVQFMMQERARKEFIYSLDVLRMYFDTSLSIGDATDNFIKRYIKDDSEERKLFLSLYK